MTIFYEPPAATHGKTPNSPAAVTSGGNSRVPPAALHDTTPDREWFRLCRKLLRHTEGLAAA